MQSDNDVLEPDDDRVLEDEDEFRDDEDDGFGVLPPDPLDDPGLFEAMPTEEDDARDPFTPVRPPSIDDYDDYEDSHIEARPPAVNYPSWTAGNSFVVSGPIGTFGFRGRRFKTREEALAWARAKYGFVYDEIRVLGRWGFRVPKPRQEAA